MKEYTENRQTQADKHNQKTETRPKEGQEKFQTKARDQPMNAAMSKRHGPHKDAKEKNIHNRYKLNHNLCMQYPLPNSLYTIMIPVIKIKLHVMIIKN